MGWEGAVGERGVLRREGTWEWDWVGGGGEKSNKCQGTDRIEMIPKDLAEWVGSLADSERSVVGSLRHRMERIHHRSVT